MGQCCSSVRGDLASPKSYSSSEDFSGSSERLGDSSLRGGVGVGSGASTERGGSEARAASTNGVKASGRNRLTPRPGIPDAKHFGLEETHVVLDVLGRGGEGSAWLMREIKSNSLCAVKLIKRPVPQVLLPFLSQEISIQAQLGRQHENIIDLEGIILTPYFLCIVLEYASGGPLTRYICERAQNQNPRNQGPPTSSRRLFLPEKEALYFFKQFISAVQFCHNNGFAHRDLKLDNTLLDYNIPPTIKISDFGFAKGSAEENTFTTIGTPCYMSPEVLTTSTTKKGYNAKRADVWACGVLLFAMLFGAFPFDSTDHDPNSITTVHDILEQQLASVAKEQKWKLPGVNLNLLSIECQELLRRIFTIDPAKRISIHDIMEHPWYKQELPETFKERLEQIRMKQLAKNEMFTKEGHYFPPFFKEKLSELVIRASKVAEGKEANQSIWLRE